MDVSVIIASYNVERYIRRAVDSALNQQDVSVEVIVIDDSSSDATRKILSGINDKRLKVIQPEHNRGPGAARNAGIAMATGEWIAILDGDDAFEPGRLLRCFTKGRQEKADIVVDNLLVCRESDGLEFPMFPPASMKKLVQLDTAAFIRGTLSHKNNYTLGYLKPLFSSHFLKKNSLSYNTELRIGEDYQLMLSALLAGGRCVVEPAAGYRYTARAGSISYRLRPEDIERMLKADAQLLARYNLSSSAKSAQYARTRWLKREYSYTQLVDAMKQKNLPTALRAICVHPSCVWLLWRPLQVRIRRLVHAL